MFLIITCFDASVTLTAPQNISSYRMKTAESASLFVVVFVSAAAVIIFISENLLPTKMSTKELQIS